MSDTSEQLNSSWSVPQKGETIVCAEQILGGQGVRLLILYLGADWWGSDARALAIQLRNLGHSLIEVGYENYFPIQWSSFALRVIRRLIRPLCAKNFNAVVREQLQNPAIDFVLVFKGILLEPATVAAFRARSVPVYCFYPDVSFAEHGSNIARCLPEYDCLFTTKEFHREDAVLKSKLQDVQLVPHGFDPEVHRPVQLSIEALDYYGCDLSFVGCWSPKKERLIAAVIESAPTLAIRLWGPGWNRAQSQVESRWMRRGAFGDELAIVYRASKINLGLLSEAGADTDQGDEVTVRTWQVPAAGGFLLHEATEELGRHFAPDAEVGTFQSSDDLPEKVKRYLESPTLRNDIAAAGRRRCQKDVATYATAARRICDYHSQRHFPERCMVSAELAT